MPRFAHLRVVLAQVKPQTEREWRDTFGIVDGELGAWDDGSSFAGFWDDDEWEYFEVDGEEDDEECDDGPTSTASSWAKRRRAKVVGGVGG
jgi:hypothetical protein